ncbi:hypothetical protein TrVFT333_007632 [Trichoderma virens FT-333]|nr:hypothetical protein TrVFT333_007632 [Trichoderma virens FT-333]
MGVEKTILEEGTGPEPQKGQTVVMGYTGWLKDTSQPDNKGKKYVRLFIRSKPPTFETAIGVQRVIKGWDEAVVTMKVGEKARLDISSDFAYGARAIPGVIPANSDLIFDVHLIQIR